MKEKGWEGEEERQAYELSGRGRILNKGTEDAVPALAGLLDVVAKGDHVERDIVLLELLREANERAGCRRAASRQRQSRAAAGSCSGGA